MMNFEDVYKLLLNSDAKTIKNCYLDIIGIIKPELKRINLGGDYFPEQNIKIEYFSTHIDEQKHKLKLSFKTFSRIVLTKRIFIKDKKCVSDFPINKGGIPTSILFMNYKGRKKMNILKSPEGNFYIRLYKTRAHSDAVVYVLPIQSKQVVTDLYSHDKLEFIFKKYIRKNKISNI